MSAEECIKNVLEMSQLAIEWNLMTGTNGNMSVKEWDTGIIYITPAKVDYRQLTSNDIVLIYPDGRTEGIHNPSSEWKLHKTIYQHIPNISAIAHTHSPYASAFAALNMSIPAVLTETVLSLGGRINVAQFALPGSEEIGVGAVACLKERNVCLLAQHGVVAVGKNAFDTIETALNVEVAAKTTHLAMQIAQPTAIPQAAQKHLQERFMENNQ